MSDYEALKAYYGNLRAERDAAVARADKAETALRRIVAEEDPEDGLGTMVLMAHIARAALGEEES